jgi:hypothetical protein
MSDGITREEFNTHMDVVHRGLVENSESINRLADSVNAFVQASTRTEEKTNHLTKEVEDVKIEMHELRKDDIRPMKADINALKTKASNNLLRWAFLISLTTIILGMSTWAYTTFRQPQADVKAAIEDQTKVNQAIFEYLRGDEE